MLFLFGMFPIYLIEFIPSINTLAKKLIEAGAIQALPPLSLAIRQEVVVDSGKAGICQLAKARSLFLESGTQPDASQGICLSKEEYCNSLKLCKTMVIS
jgi:hypothetical protein